MRSSTGRLRAASKRLGNLGKVEKIADPDAFLLRPNMAERDIHGTWRKIASQLGKKEMAAPVYLDSDGNPAYPTGDITVRFSRPLDDRQLADFASQHQLRLTARNEFIPEQAAFAPVDLHNSYLPDVLAKVEAEEMVHSAWPKTTSSYQRTI